jgi:hypothetical protein
VEYLGELTSEFLAGGDFTLSREALRCECGQQFSLAAARKAAQLPEHPILWGKTENGVARPIVCPKCQNYEYFVQEQIESVTSAAHVQITDGKVQQLGVGGDPKTQQVITLRYRCETEDCEGIVELCPSNYELVKSP